MTIGRTSARKAVAVALALLLASSSFSAAQDVLVPPADVPDGAAPSDPMPLQPTAPDAPGSAGFASPTTAPRPKQDRLTVDAKLADDGAVLPGGLVWRVFGDHPGADGKLPLVKEVKGGTFSEPLPPGDYIIHAAYGRAVASQKITVSGGSQHETIVLNAGGLKLSAMVGKDQQPAANLLDFDIYAGQDSTDGGDGGGDGERTLLVPHVEPDTILRLNAGTYHVVSRYGDTNAVVRADIRVQAGKLTEATMYHQAARITLKLVSEAGGEALANTSWSVMTPGGDSVFDSVGAFPDVVLAIGQYTAIAKHDDKIHERSFTVEAGRNREIEVIAK